MTNEPPRTHAQERRHALVGGLVVGCLLLLAAPMASADHVATGTPIGSVAAHAEGTSAQASGSLGASTGMVPVALPVAGGASSSLSASASPGGASMGTSASGGAYGLGTSASIGASASPPPMPELPAKTSGKANLLGQAFEWFIGLF